MKVQGQYEVNCLVWVRDESQTEDLKYLGVLLTSDGFGSDDFHLLKVGKQLSSVASLMLPLADDVPTIQYFDKKKPVQ